MRDRSAPLTAEGAEDLAWEKMGGLLPAAVQDAASGRLLMLGYMDKDSLRATLETGFVAFFSRSTQRLWMKGETSGNRLRLMSVHEDCDGDALLVTADPDGPTCHLGTASCFGGELRGPGWLADLGRIVGDRARSGKATSYTRRLLDAGLPRIAQKIGEEGVELALAAVTRDTRGCAEEAADLLYHMAVLMEAKGIAWDDIIAVLRDRHASSATASS